MTARWLSGWVMIYALSAAPLCAQFDSGSDGSDGAFGPTANVVVDLSQAAIGPWDMASPATGNGVYDPDLWAVVFKYTTINIPSTVDVRFENHPSGAPVVWLASGNVTVAGSIVLDGGNGGSETDIPSFAEPGPGGFAGGRRATNDLLLDSAGFGPGGGNIGNRVARGGGAGFATAGESGLNSLSNFGTMYGSEALLPLIGGCGGGGGGRDTEDGSGRGGGGAGGGAILIASSGDISVQQTGLIMANGGDGGAISGGGGSGGAIRLLANTISGDGRLRAKGGASVASDTTQVDGEGSDGRIRLEGKNVTLVDSDPDASFALLPEQIFPGSGAPTLIATLIDSQPVPSDPAARISTVDVEIDNENAVTLQIEATNVPEGTTVDVFVIPARGLRTVTSSTPLVAGKGGLLSATAALTLPPGRSEIQLRANWVP